MAQRGGESARAPSRAQAARRRRILEAAVAQLDDHDYQRVQIRHVADEAGVALATVYRHFESKERLYAQVLLDWCLEYGPESLRAPRHDHPWVASDSSEARLRATMQNAISAFEQRPNFWQLMTLFEHATDPVVRTRYAAFIEAFLGPMRGLMPDIDPADATRLTIVCGTMLSLVMRRWDLGELSLGEARTQVDDIVRILFRLPRPAPDHPTPNEM